MSQSPRLFISVYLDKDLSYTLAGLLREQGFDAIAAQEVGNDRLFDWQQLAFAVSQGRAIVTRNRDHFIELHNEYWDSGKTHYGIIIATQLGTGRLLRRMLNLLDSVTADEMMNTLRYLSEFK